MKLALLRAGGVVALAASLLAVALYGVAGVPASDHQDSPMTVSHPGIDLTDVFVFPSSTNPRNVVLAMDVWPFIPTGMGATEYFDPRAMYQFKIGTGSHYNEDLVIQFKTGGVGTSQQIASPEREAASQRAGLMPEHHDRMRFAAWRSFHRVQPAPRQRHCREVAPSVLEKVFGWPIRLRLRRFVRS